MEEGGEREAEQTSDLDTTQQSEAHQDLTAYFPVLADHLSKLGMRISTINSLNFESTRLIIHMQAG